MLYDLALISENQCSKNMIMYDMIRSYAKHLYPRKSQKHWSNTESSDW